MPHVVCLRNGRTRSFFICDHREIRNDLLELIIHLILSSASRNWFEHIFFFVAQLSARQGKFYGFQSRGDIEKPRYRPAMISRVWQRNSAILFERCGLRRCVIIVRATAFHHAAKTRIEFTRDIFLLFPRLVWASYFAASCNAYFTSAAITRTMIAVAEMNNALSLRGDSFT